ncbi:DUF155 domain-containing protein [Mycena kentingensis (nom. inval.)]|nr:DUF155 domain-containing protein [Mycena kentingensis (nom. inval.)]
MSLSAFASVLRRAARLPRTARAYSEKPPSSAPQTLLSTCPADTPLKGVNYLKGQTTVVARPDEEYPEWLWKVLRPREWPESEMGPGGLNLRLAVAAARVVSRLASAGFRGL